MDFFNYTKDWYNTLKAEGFSAFGRDFSNYNLPYLYLLYAVVRFLPDVPPVIAVKIPSLVADFVAAFLVIRIVQTVIEVPVDFLPGGILFSHCADGRAQQRLLGAGGRRVRVRARLLASCFFFAKQDSLAMALFGLALALKAQSLFLAPLLGGLVLRREIRWRTLIWIPVVFLVLLVPAWAAGRSTSGTAPHLSVAGRHNTSNSRSTRRRRWHGFPTRVATLRTSTPQACSSQRLRRWG